MRGRRAQTSCSSAPRVVNSLASTRITPELPPGDCTPVRLKKLLVRAGTLRVRPTDRLVLVALLGFADHRTHECFPTQDSLAELTGQARSTVIASTRRLEAVGLLSRSQDPLTRAYTYRLVDTQTDANPNQVLAEQTRARIDEDPTRAGYATRKPRRARGVRVLPGQLPLDLPPPELTWGAPVVVDGPTDVQTPRVVAQTHQDGGRPALPEGFTPRNHPETPLTPPAGRGDREIVSSFFEHPARSLSKQEAERVVAANELGTVDQAVVSAPSSVRPEREAVEPCKPVRVLSRLPFTPQQVGEIFTKHAPERSVLSGALERRLERRFGYVILDLVRAGFGLDDVALAARYYEKNDTPFLRGTLGWSSLMAPGRLRDLIAFALKEHTKELARARTKPVVPVRRTEVPPSATERLQLVEMARLWRTQGLPSESAQQVAAG